MNKHVKKLVLFLILVQSLISAQEIIHYDESNSPLSSNKLTALAIDSTNNIFVANDSILFKFNNDEWSKCLELSESTLIPDIDVSPNGTIYTISSNYHTNLSNIHFYRDNQWVIFKPDLSSIFKSPINISTKNDSTIYFPLFNDWNNNVGMNSVGVFCGGDSISIRSPNLYFITSIASIDNDSILVTAANDIYKIKDLELDSVYSYDAKWLYTIKNPEWDSRYWNQSGWSAWMPLVKNVNNRTFALGKNVFEYKNDNYISYPEIDSVLSADSLIASTINIEKDNILWVGTSSGKLIKFSNSVQTFEFTNSAIKDIAIDNDGNKWFISNEGLFVFNEDKIVSIKNNPEVISNFKLYQNYPNPFNPNTEIRYDIGDKNFVTLIVYDILGREIETLVSKEQLSGSYKINFNAKNLTTGIYYYRLQCGNYIESKKMLLLK